MRRPRVLLVDDTPEIIEFCSDVLAADYEIVGTAPDGVSALALAEETAPDVVVLDVTMPELNGIEVAKRLRSAGFRGAIVFLSGSGEYEAAALDAGGSSFVSKAKIGSDLQVAIAEALAGRRFVSEPPREPGEDQT